MSSSVRYTKYLGLNLFKSVSVTGGYDEQCLCPDCTGHPENKKDGVNIECVAKKDNILWEVLYNQYKVSQVK